jgi:mono/diheme cytochrome c family protein
MLGAYAVRQTQSGSTPQTQTPSTQAAPAAPVDNGANLVNPVKPTAATLATAKEHYSWDCAMCHGDTGKGNGSLATSEKLSPGDLTSPATLQGMTDGQIFVVIRKGSKDMPPEDKARADDATVWSLVNYLRTLSKPATSPAS